MAPDKVRQLALRILERRAVSCGMLRERLRQRGADDTDIEALIDDFTRVGLLDDRAFAEMVVRSQLARKPAGPRYLDQTLRRKHIDEATRHAVVTAALAERDLLDDAVELATRRLRGMQTLEPATIRRRLYGQLARRGYENETVQRAIELALADVAR
jgi:regulatory protein